MDTEYKHIHFTKLETSSKRKTFIWECRHNEDNTFLGEVKWYGTWRQYCFYTNGEIILAQSCLKDIDHFINRKMLDRRIMKAVRKARL